jgi:hypothetical protein
MREDRSPAELKVEILSRSEERTLASESLHYEAPLTGGWLKEIRRRRAQIARGEVKLVDADEMFARINARRL